MRNVKLSVVLLLVASLLGLGLLRGVDLLAERRTQIDAAERAVDAWARLMEQYVRRTFETSDLIFERVQGHARERGGVRRLRDVDTHRMLVDMASRTAGDYLMIVDERGSPVSMSAFHPAAAVDLSDRQWFRAHRDLALDRFVGPPLISRLVDSILFTYSRTLREERGDFAGVLQVSMRASFFDDAPLRYGAAGGEHVAFEMWSFDGALIGRSEMTAAMVDANLRSGEVARATLRANEGRLSDPSPVTGKPQIAAFRVLPEWGVVIVAGVSHDGALAAWRSELQGTLELAPWAALFLLALGVVALAAARNEEVLTARLSHSRSELAARNEELEAAVRMPDLLVKEIHHRVKNNLQVVASLVRLQARRSSDLETFISTTQDRIQAIAMMHELVYQRDIEGAVDLGAFLEKLMQASRTAHGARERNITIEASYDPIELGIAEMVPVGLIMAEALSNVFKHAFPEHRPGAIALCARRSGETAIIEVRDNGVGLREGARRSLGGTLVSTLAAQINGRHELVREDGWTVFRLSFGGAHAGHRASDSVPTAA